MKELIDLGFKKDTEFYGYRYIGAFNILYMSRINKLYIFCRNLDVLYFEYDINICKLYIEGYEKFRKLLYSILHTSYAEYLDIFIDIHNKDNQNFKQTYILGNREVNIKVAEDKIYINSEFLMSITNFKEEL